MLHSVFACDFENSDPPVDLCFFTDGEAVRIYEGDVGVGECGVEIGFIVAVTGDEGYVWEGGE
jgi:hypothetical protein